MKRAKILLLEDDMSLNETIGEYLDEAGFEVVSTYEGSAAEDAIYEQTFDLLLLDVNVPEPNGFTLLKSAREAGTLTPAIYITARSGLDDLEDGYKSGADDYIRKPFALKELLLRVESILKRNYVHRSDERIAINDHAAFDTDSNELYIDGERIALHEKEARLLKLFMQRRGEVIVHEVIYDVLWGYDETPSNTALRTYIKNLRKLLGKESIVSFKRTGYQFR